MAEFGLNLAECFSVGIDPTADQNTKSLSQILNKNRVSNTLEMPPNILPDQVFVCVVTTGLS